MQRDYVISRREEAIDRAVGPVWAEMPREYLTEDEAAGMRLDDVAEYNADVDPSGGVVSALHRDPGALAETFDAMNLGSQRDLMRSMLSIEVVPVAKGCSGSRSRGCKAA